MRVKVLLDLDGEGMIINTSWRNHQADLIAQQKASRMETPPVPPSNEYKSLFYSTDAFYNEEFMQHDELNPDAASELALLLQRYQDVQILTARLDYLEPDTTRRLTTLGIAAIPIRYKLSALSDDEPREQYTATATWKAQVVQAAAPLYDLVIFADDEARNRKAVEALHLGNVVVCASLAECLAL